MLLLVIPALAVTAVALASFAGRWLWWLDVLANFRPLYALTLIPFGLVFLASRWRRTGYLVMVAGLINLAVVAPLYAGSPGRSDPGLPAVRILSHNLLSTNEGYADLVAMIRAEQPDLVFLHESSRPWEVALAAAGLDYQVVRSQSDDLIFGTLVMARGDGAVVVSHGFTEDQPRSVSVSYRPPGWPVDLQVIAVHTLAPTTEERALLRNAQLLYAGRLAAEAEGPAVVVGDLNATPWSWAFGALAEEGGLANSQRGFGLQPSFPVDANPLLRVPIDHLLHDDELRTRHRRLGPSLGSDHFSLIVDLELVAPSAYDGG